VTKPAETTHDSELGDQDRRDFPVHEIVPSLPSDGIGRNTFVPPNDIQSPSTPSMDTARVELADLRRQIDAGVYRPDLIEALTRAAEEGTKDNNVYLKVERVRLAIIMRMYQVPHVRRGTEMTSTGHNLQQTPTASRAGRRLVGKQSTGPLRRRPRVAASTVTAVSSALMFGKGVTPERRQKRLEICSSCDKMVFDGQIMRCGMCGCKLHGQSGALVDLLRYEETPRYGCKHPHGSRWKAAGV